MSILYTMDPIKLWSLQHKCLILFALALEMPLSTVPYFTVDRHIYMYTQEIIVDFNLEPIPTKTLFFRHRVNYILFCLHMQGMLIPDKYLCHSPLMIACEEDKENIVELLLKNGASVALKNKVVIPVASMDHNYSIYGTVVSTALILLFQNGLTAVHIACKNGRRVILSCLLEEAKTQKHFCFKRKLSSDYDVVISAKAREVRRLCNYPHDCKLTSKVHY